MKIPTFVLFLSASVLSAADSALPNFSATPLERPALSLSEAVTLGQLPPFDPLARYTAEKLRRASLAQVQLVSRMPVIEPSADADRNMPVATPRSDVDLKMLVKDPSVDSAP